LTGFSGQAIILSVRKADLLNELSSARSELVEALSGLTPEQMLITGVVGLWSVKDVLAHLAAWESEVVTALNQAQNKRIPALLSIEDIDEWNDEQYRVNIRRPLAVISSDFEGVHKMLRRMIEDLDEGWLLDNRRFAWMEGEPLWFLIEENVVLHEQEHAAEIRHWREDTHN
jgi:Protein of unknown function (DUF1706)